MSDQQPLTPDQVAAYKKMDRALKFESVALKAVMVFFVLGLLFAIAVGVGVAILL